MIATLIGGTGLTGTSLLRRLLADVAITRVISVSRRPSSISHEKLTEVRIQDLAELPVKAAAMRGDLYFCCLGTTIKAAGSRANFERVDRAAVVAFAGIARAHDARSFTLVSAMGADGGSRFFYNRVKGRTEEDVKQLGFRSLIVFRPALLVGPRREFRAAEAFATRTLLPLSRLLPATLGKRFVTDVEALSAQMLIMGKAAPPGLHLIGATAI
jgi:uncharacterized protein YbjT (DUF2867 family)